uniref:Uncharacterized protein n=1 Tax=Lactuca sativa TaxID=4236 RepID=A0A9R1WYE1_LACSA|nr:hypothetical protein LSAT_V11C800439620 [Lactuca sativa]
MAPAVTVRAPWLLFTLIPTTFPAIRNYSVAIIDECKLLKSIIPYPVASSSGTKKVKGLEKVYVRDEDSDDDLIYFSFLDFAPEIFKPTSKLSGDSFLNILFDENMLGRNLDGMGDDDHEVGVKDP